MLRRDLVGWPGVGVSLTIALVLLLSGSESLPALEPTQTPVEIRVEKPFGQTSLRVEWQAQVHQTGGRFLLFRGRHPQAVELVAEVAATSSGTYGFVDAEALPEDWIYELRYLDRAGREYPLTRVRVSFSYQAPVPAEASLGKGPGASPWLQPGLWGWDDLALVRASPLAEGPAPCRDAPEPLLPPPRST
jgi:hypothetical protein